MNKCLKFGTICLLVIFCLFRSDNCFSSPKAAYNHNKKGVEFMASGKFEEAIAEFKVAYNYAPGNDTLKRNLMVAYNNYGFKLRQEGNLSSAIEEYQKALYYDQDSAYTYYNLGQAYYLMQDIEKAKANLLKAYRIKPGLKGLRSLLEKVSGEVTVQEGFNLMDTLHFLIKYSDDTLIDKVSYIKTYLEEAYGTVGMFLDHYPEVRTAVIVYPEGRYNRLLNGQPHWTMAIYDGKIRIPAGKFKYTNEDVVKIMFHEYAHVIITELSKGRCPGWFSEGIASKAEDYVEPKDREIIKKYIMRHGFMDIKTMPNDMRSVSGRDNLINAYIQAYLVVDYIEKMKGSSALKEILERVGKGEGLIRVIEKIFYEPIPLFQQKWQMFVVDEYRIDVS